jgi:hypothetical protein
VILLRWECGAAPNHGNESQNPSVECKTTAPCSLPLVGHGRLCLPDDYRITLPRVPLAR